MKRLSLFATLAMVVSLVGLVSPASAATTHYVNDDVAIGANTSCADPGFNSIQAAVTAATAGDTIQVCAGTYSEGVAVTKSLTLLGPNAGTSALATRVAEAHITTAATTVNIQSPDVTVNGFQVTGDFGVYVDTAATSNAKVLNNIVSGTSWATGLVTSGSGHTFEGNHLTSPVRTFHLSAGPYQTLTVKGNRTSGAGTIFWSGNSAIVGLDFENNEILNGSSNLASRISNGDVSGNTFTPAASGSLAIQINLHESTVTNNTFDGNDTSRCLQIYGTQFGLDPSKNVTISGNTFTDCGGATAGAMWALQLSVGIDEIDITDNDFVDTKGDAINTRFVMADGTWTVDPDIDIFQNNITGSTGFGRRA